MLYRFYLTTGPEITVDEEQFAKFESEAAQSALIELTPVEVRPMRYEDIARKAWINPSDVVSIIACEQSAQTQSDSA